MRDLIREAIVTPLAVLHRVLRRPAERWRLWWDTARARALFEAVGAEVRCYGRVHRMGTGRVRLGERGNLYEGVLLETQGPGTITVGEGFVLNRGVVITAFAGVRLGRGVLVGEYTSIRDQDHAIAGAGAIAEQGYEAAPIEIGDDVWIGRGCAILAGVRIGARAVVGANSVVTKDVPSGSIVAGAPARVLGQR